MLPEGTTPRPPRPSRRPDSFQIVQAGVLTSFRTLTGCESAVNQLRVERCICDPLHSL